MATRTGRNSSKGNDLDAKIKILEFVQALERRITKLHNPGNSYPFEWQGHIRIEQNSGFIWWDKVFVGTLYRPGMMILRRWSGCAYKQSTPSSSYPVAPHKYRNNVIKQILERAGVI